MARRRKRSAAMSVRGGSVGSDSGFRRDKGGNPGKFRVGWSGSPFHTGYVADEGWNAQPPSERGLRIGSGALGERVEMESQRSGSGPAGRRSDVEE